MVLSQQIKNSLKRDHEDEEEKILTYSQTIALEAQETQTKQAQNNQENQNSTNETVQELKKFYTSIIKNETLPLENRIKAAENITRLVIKTQETNDKGFNQEIQELIRQIEKIPKQGPSPETLETSEKPSTPPAPENTAEPETA